ncbi:MAG: tetratricopeptide repeat protein [Christensenellaceae bacterium]|nr:tetratricopeptide repeat protein [Christensenellaceae bacterium]
MTYFILLLIYFALLGIFGIWLPSIGIDFGNSIPSIFGAIIAVQVFNHRAHRPNFSRLKLHYRQRYAEYIGNAFDGKRKQEKALYLAIDDIHSGNYKRTKNAAKQLLKLKAETDDEQFVREVFFGMAQKEMHDIPEAILAYRRAFKIKEDAGILSEIGRLFETLHDYDNALACLEKAAEIGPENALAQNNLGQFYMRAGEYEKAIPYFLAAENADESFQPALSGLAACYKITGNDAGYEEYVQKAVENGAYKEVIDGFISEHKRYER